MSRKGWRTLVAAACSTCVVGTVATAARAELGGTVTRTAR